MAADIATYVAPGAEGLCSKDDDADKASSTQLQTAFITILIAHIVLVCMWGGAQAGMTYVTSWPEGNLRKPELDNHTDSEKKEQGRVLSYMLLVIGGFLSAWMTKALGYGSLSNIPTEDCLHGTFRLAWFQLFLWLSNVVYLGDLVVLACGGTVVLAVVGTVVFMAPWAVCVQRDCSHL